MIYDLNIELRVKDKFKTDFALRIVKYLIKNVKYGEIISYSKIGKEIGSKAYRAIGNVLKKNSLPLIIPCHRVIKADGTIGGFMGKTNNNWQQQLKIDLLKIEGFEG